MLPVAQLAEHLRYAQLQSYGAEGAGVDVEGKVLAFRML